jgi:periplasmic divalent cation tolerance protein
MRDPAALPPDGECDVVEIRTTFCAREQAEACAERLVRERFAACAQVEGPLRSTYRWQGAVEKAEEWRCTCKTAPDRVAACLEAITRGHDYDLPETLVTPSTATAAYAAWVRASVTA